MAAGPAELLAAVAALLLEERITRSAEGLFQESTAASDSLVSSENWASTSVLRAEADSGRLDLVGRDSYDEEEEILECDNVAAEEEVAVRCDGAGSIVAIMIGNLKGMEILRRIESGLKVTMVIEVGKKHGPLMNYYSIFFVSVSFFVVTAAIMGYFIFYSARRFRVSRAQSRAQRQLKAKAKKALGKLQLRTLKEGDKETGPDGDTCAVCIDLYKPDEVVRILACNHVFHKICVDPWLLEHRTCPLCKYDILKVLSPEEDEGAGAVSVQTRVYAVTSTVAFVNEVENSTENESSGDTSVQAPVEIALVDRQPPENDDACLVSDESQPSAESVLPPVENPTFEADETQVSEDKL
ncbi:hypothetical protein ASZ78_016559 [Callipepla squamata]|uniref:RING-type domain-containing protein n=1 Tax=Callipepla squamata TaxID=9009 RepID=A0A226MDR1_CALSU|nr:hypothetical protein ASZ78_016559 [Callipepla squamata]